MSQTPAGWYDDGQGAQRWWDGSQWTDHTRGGTPGPSGPSGESGDGGADPHAEPTRVGGPEAGTPAASSDRPAPPSGDEPPPSADVTMVAPQGGHQPMPGHSGYRQPGQPQGGYQQPGYQQPGYQQPGGPGVPAWQQPYGGGSSSGGGNGKLVALVALLCGGAVFVIAAVVVLIVVLGGDGGDDGDDGGAGESASEPEAVLQSAFDSIRSGDCGYASYLSNALLSTDEAGRDAAVEAFRSTCENAGSGVPEEAAGCEIDISNEDVVEEDVRVGYDYEISGCDDSSQDEASGATMIKENDEWRIEDF